MAGQQDALTILCVLQRGGPYDFGYVKALSQGVRRHLHWPHRFLCLTDVDLLNADWYRAHQIDCRRLRHTWPGDWSILEVFRPGLLINRAIYLDLNVMVTGSLFELGHYSGRFAMSQDEAGHFNTSIMMWNSDELSSCYTRFTADPILSFDERGSAVAWIKGICASERIGIEHIQDFVPNLMTGISTVPGGAPRRAVSPGVGLVSFRNSPFPHVLADGSDFIRTHWV